MKLLKVGFADFETTTTAYSTEMTTVYIWGVNDSQNKFVWGIDLKSFFEYLITTNYEVIYFQNLSWDGTFIYSYLLDHGFTFIFDNGEKVNLKPNEFTWYNNSGRIYWLDVNYGGKILSFKCSYLIFMASVKKLGEHMEFEKGDLNYDLYKPFKDKSEVPQELLTYLKRDIDIIIKTSELLQEIYVLKSTRAATSMYDFKNEYGKELFRNDFGDLVYTKNGPIYKSVLSKDDWDYIAKSYHGGYSNWNKKFYNIDIKCEKGVALDINSHYPNIMANYNMPYGKMLKEKPAGTYVELLDIYIIKAKLQSEKAPAFLRDYFDTNQKYADHIKNAHFVMFREKWDLIKECYDIEYRITNIYYFKSKPIFKPWINQNLSNKIKAVEANEQTHVMYFKGILNSLYGKFCQDYHIRHRIIKYDPLILKKDDHNKERPFSLTRAKFIDRDEVRYGKNNEYYHAKTYTESYQFKHIAVGSYITTMAFVELARTIIDNYDKWIYSDTDSAYFTSMPDNVGIHPTQLGKWKLEYEFNRFKIIKAKCYIFNVIAKYEYNEHTCKRIEKEYIIKKIAGVGDKGRQQINFETFQKGNIIKNAKKSKKFIKGGLVLVDVDYKI